MTNSTLSFTHSNMCFNNIAGSELQAWLLYYSLPVLHGILPSPYLAHLSLLVAAVHILMSARIHRSDLSIAHQFLDTFYKQSSTLYGMFNDVND